MTVLRAALAFAVLLALPAVAEAGTVRVESGMIIFTGTSAARTSRWSIDGATHHVESDKASRSADPACAPVAERASCTGGSFDVSLIGTGSLFASGVDSGATLHAAGSPGSDDLREHPRRT